MTRRSSLVRLRSTLLVEPSASSLPASFHQLARFCLRIYAITPKNKTTLAYFGSMVLARFGVWLASTFSTPPVIVNYAPSPVDALNQCAILSQPKHRLVPNSIGTAFGT